MSKKGKGWRKITVRGTEYIWECGIQHVVIRAFRRKFIVPHAELLGMGWDSIERYRWKNRGEDHPANIRPNHIESWIREHVCETCGNMLVDDGDGTFVCSDRLCEANWGVDHY